MQAVRAEAVAGSRVKYVCVGFLALLASVTIIVISSGAAGSLLFRQYLTREVNRETGRLERALALGCERTAGAQTVRCPVWVTNVTTTP